MFREEIEAEWEARKVEMDRLLKRCLAHARRNYPLQDPKTVVAFGVGVSWRAIHEWKTGRVPRKNKFALLQAYAKRVLKGGKNGPSVRKPRP